MRIRSLAAAALVLSALSATACSGASSVWSGFPRSSAIAKAIASQLH